MKRSVKTMVGASLAATAAIAAFQSEGMAKAETYTIKFGDTLSELAEQFDTTIAQLRDDNQIENIDLIYAGDTLEINAAKPAQVEETKTADENNMYTVVAGDTLSKIAQAFQTTVNQLRNWNNLSGDLILVGQQLKVAADAQAEPVANNVNVEAEAPAKVEKVETEQVEAEQTAPVQAKVTDYTVQPGDTLSGIAAQFGLTVDQLQTLNDLTSDFIYSGQSLSVDADQLAAKEQAKAQAEAAAKAQAEKEAQEQAAQAEAAAKAQAEREAQEQAAKQQAIEQAQQQAQQQQAQKPATPVVNNNQTQVSGSVLDIAASYLGTPYVWGGSTPNGFDCSGFVQYVYAQAGRQLSRTTQTQEYEGTQISVSNAKPGDLLFWGSYGNAYHVAIYVGNGQYIHAPQPGESVSYGTISQYFMPSFAVSM
ncbi:MAG: LysM peptidoglycan-binding domain-containing protein [Aerococcus sp.]|nr:LysM peptidoglycan-binding domain-containing protein [Aerococcus sp.]